MSPIKSKRISILQMGGIALFVALITFALTSFLEKAKPEAETAQVSSNCNYNVKRIEGYDYIKPLLFVDEDCEADALVGIREKVNAIFEKYEASGDLNSASFYMKNHEGWTLINGGEKYEPGSLFKVPLLIAALKMNEDRPGFLDRKVLFEHPFPIGRAANIKSKTLTVGKTYSIRELLEYMIQYSDNDATCLLEINMDMRILQKLFADIGLEVPNMSADKFYFTPRDYSSFMRIIYNAGYLTIKDSEYAAELLSKCDFKDGIVKGIPENIKVAHKFGETGNETEKQLHETGIVYMGNKPYLITIMTKGKDFGKLSQLLADVSAAVYQEMLNK